MLKHLVGISLIGLLLPACIAEMGDEEESETTAAFASKRVRGSVNGHGVFIEGNNFVVKGWACDRGVAKHIGVRVYAGSRNGKFLGSATARMGGTSTT